MTGPAPGVVPLLVLASSVSVCLACGRGSPETHGAQAQGDAVLASSPELTERFGDVTDKFYTGNNLGLADLVGWAESVLAQDRRAAYADANGGVRYPIVLPPNERIRGNLLVLPPEDGVREFQLEFEGPATCGAFLPHVAVRRFRVSFGLNERNEPLFAMGGLRDVVERSPEALRLYQGMAATAVGGVFKAGATQEETYWRPTTLRAIVDSDVEGAPGMDRITWEYRYGSKAHGAMSDLSAILPLLRLLP